MGLHAPEGPLCHRRGQPQGALHARRAAGPGLGASHPRGRGEAQPGAPLRCLRDFADFWGWILLLGAKK